MDLSLARAAIRRTVGRWSLAFGLTLSGSLSPASLPAQRADAGVNVAALGHDLGNARASVWIIEFGDFGCGYCAQFNRNIWPVLDSLYVRTGKVRWKYIPFVLGSFRNSREVSEAAECAAEQGAFWKISDVLFARRREWMASSTPRELAARYAKELGLDQQAFSRCAMSTAAQRRILQNTSAARSLYLRGTPTFFVNGQMYPGMVPLNEFRKLIDSLSR
jgi:protein-disulfide isomerase